VTRVCPARTAQICGKSASVLRALPGQRLLRDYDHERPRAGAADGGQERG
jgi:hypothetical protein